MFELTTNVSIADTTLDWYCWYNETAILFVPDESYCICNATTVADSDIAGIGVITSFVGMALCTIVVALIPVWHDFRFKQRSRLMKALRPMSEDDQSSCSASNNVTQSLPRSFHDHSPERTSALMRECPTVHITSGVEWEQTHHKLKPSPKEKRLLHLADRLLGNLCDLQLLTGVAVMTAGFAQGSNLSFYHESFISIYCNLALVSFWAGRQDRIWDDTNRIYAQNPNGTTGTSGTVSASSGNGSAPSSVLPKVLRIAKQTDAFFRGGDRFRAYLRRLCLFICTTMLVIFNVRILRVQYYENHWDPFRSGRCYLMHDKAGWASFWLWQVGTASYAFVLLLSLVNKTKRMILMYSAWLPTAEERVLRQCVVQWRKLKMLIRNSPRRNLGSSLQVAVRSAMCAGLAAIMLLTFVMIQFLSIWTFGDGFYALEVAFYLGNWAWCFYDIIDLKLSNKRVIVGNELAWGFGQVLAVVLMGAVVFYLVDALAEEKLAEKRLDPPSV